MAEENPEQLTTLLQHFLAALSSYGYRKPDFR